MNLVEEALSLIEEARTKRTPVCLELYEEAGKRLVAEVDGLRCELVDTGKQLEAALARIEALTVENTTLRDNERIRERQPGHRWIDLR